MDTRTVAIFIIIMLVIFLPFVILNNIGKNVKRKLYKQFNSIAVKNELNINEKEFWANSYIGMDSAKKRLLFLNTDEGRFEDGEMVDLNTIKECNVVTSIKSINTKLKKENVLLKVALEIYYLDNRMPMKSLNFYDHNLPYNEDFELKRAEKWEKLIKDQIPTLKHT